MLSRQARSLRASARLTKGGGGGLDEEEADGEVAAALAAARAAADAADAAGRALPMSGTDLLPALPLPSPSAATATSTSTSSAAAPMPASSPILTAGGRHTAVAGAAPAKASTTAVMPEAYARTRRGGVRRAARAPLVASVSVKGKRHAENEDRACSGRLVEVANTTASQRVIRAARDRERAKLAAASTLRMHMTPSMHVAHASAAASGLDTKPSFIRATDTEAFRSAGDEDKPAPPTTTPTPPTPPTTTTTTTTTTRDEDEERRSPAEHGESRRTLKATASASTTASRAARGSSRPGSPRHQASKASHSRDAAPATAATAAGGAGLNDDEFDAVDAGEVSGDDDSEDSQSDDGDLKGAFLRSLWVGLVVDGHGGPGCAAFVEETLPALLYKNVEAAELEDFSSIESVLRETFAEVDGAFEAEVASTKDQSGACATMVLVGDDEILVAHCGDARAVLSYGGAVHVLTRDHRADDPVEAERITKAGGTVLNGRVGGMLAPSRAFGDADLRAQMHGALVSTPDVVRVRARSRLADISAEAAKAVASENPGNPSFSEAKARAEPVFLILATDGVWEVMSTVEACDIVSKCLARNPDPDLAARKLAAAASFNPDDVSVCVVNLNPPASKPTASRPFMSRVRNFVSRMSTDS